MIKRSHSWNDNTAQSNGQSVTGGYVHHTRHKWSVFRLIWQNVRISGRLQSILDVAKFPVGPVSNLLESDGWKIRMTKCPNISDRPDILTKNKQSSQKGGNNKPQKARYWDHSGVIEDNDGVCLKACVRESVVYNTHHVINRQRGIE